jgi:hypothetical protein
VACTETGAVQAQGHCYFGLAKASFDNAAAACTAVGAHMVTIGDATEQTSVASILATDERWIGLRRPAGSAVADASYAWINNEPRNFQNWAAAKNEPDGSCPTCTVAGQAACGRILTTGEWADDDCTVEHPVICERE